MTVCADNIKIMAKNTLDDLVIKATTEQAAYPVANLLNPQISSKWRSTDLTMQILTIDGASLELVSGMSINGHNMGYGSTVTLSVYQKRNTLVTIGVTPITGQERNISFSTVHNVPFTRPTDEYTDETNSHSIAITDEASGIVWVYQCWYISTTILRVNAYGTELDGGGINNNDQTQVLKNVYEESVGGIPATLGWGDQPWGIDGWGGYAQNMADQDFATIWFEAVQADYYVVKLEDANNSDGYIEAGRLFIGNAFKPTYNFQWNASVDYQSETSVTRSRSGALFSDNRPSFRILSIDLQYMSEAEGMEMLRYMKYPSNKRDAVISMYPENNATLEQETTVLGRFMSHSPLGRSPEGYTMNFIFEEAL